MEKLQVFQNAEFGSVRAVEIDKKLYFVGKDVANALGYSNPRDAISRHCKGVVKHDTFKEGGQLIALIPEGDMYRLITHSKLESAERFEKWIFDEVLPSIRRNGAYMTEDTLEKALTSPDFLIQLAMKLKDEQEKNKALTEDNARMKPKEIFADAVAASNTSILIGELAKLLSQNGYVTGQNRLFTILRDKGYLIKSGTSKNMPTQSSMERGLFEIKETIIHNPDGSIRINKTPKVTGKGQQYFINKFLYERKKDGNSNNEDIKRSSTDHRSIL